MPWDMGKFTHDELYALEEKHMLEKAEREAEKRRLGG